MREAERAASACIAENTMTAFAAGGLSREERSRVEAHLAVCASCGELLAHALSEEHPGHWAAAASDPASSGPLELSRGTRVGRYEILELVGAGAMGAVYVAHDPDLDRRVALKILRSIGDDHQLRARLSREARAMARLSHPNVITVHDVGAHASHLFVAMEFVAGGTLRQWVAARRREWRETLAVFVRAGRGLACAHAAGLVHRDFKPDNVLVGEDGRVRVTDFGLARGVRDAAHGGALAETSSQSLDATITRTGALIGTPAYMAPEQLRGEPADARADTFSFCVALYEALYGDRPFDGRNIVRLRESTSAGLVREAPAGSPVPDRVRRVLLAGLRPRPEDRPGRVDDLLDALERAATEPARAIGVDADTLSPTEAPRGATPVARGGRATRRWALGIALGAAALTLAGTFGLRRTDAPASRPPAAPGVPAEVALQPLPLPALDVVPSSPPAAPAPTPSSEPPRPTPRITRRAGATAANASPSAMQSPAPPTAASSGPPPASAPTTQASAAPLGGRATYDRE